jgi:hypothetical protein
MAGIIAEGKSIMEEDFDEATTDATLIAAGQRAEHYEMAAYGTLIAWARALGHAEAADLLQETLNEEKAADEKLSGLAEGGINSDAADAAGMESDDSDEEDMEDDDEVGTARAKSEESSRASSRSTSGGRSAGSKKASSR